MRRALFASLIWPLFCGCSASAKGPPPSAPSALLAAGAPELHRPTLNPSGTANAPLLSLQDVRGRIVIVDFFAEYCKPCLRVLSELEDLRHSRPSIEVIGIAEDPEPDTSLRLMQQLKLGFPVVFDRDQVIAGRYRVAGLPATFVLDRAGVVRWVSNGACAGAELEAVLDSLK